MCDVTLHKARAGTPAGPTFASYANDHFELHRKGLFKTLATVDKVTSWKKTLIKTALLQMPKGNYALIGLSTQAFKNVVCFMGDRTSTKETDKHAQSLLAACAKAPQELHDEIYCAIMKQLTKNPSPASVEKGWALMSVFTGAYAPSVDLTPVVAAFCAEGAANGAGKAATYAAYAAGRLSKTVNMTARTETPSEVELAAVMAMKPVLLKVHFVDGSYEYLPVTSWTTPSNLLTMACKKRGIWGSEPFGIYEMTPDGSERLLPETERILDVVAFWQRLFELEKASEAAPEAVNGGTKKARALKNQYYFMLKVHKYFKPHEGDVAAELAMYAQAVYDVNTSRYPSAGVGGERLYELAALQMQAELGDAACSKVNLKSVIKHFMPPSFAPTFRVTLDTWVTEITKAHGRLNGMTTAEAQEAYLAVVRGWNVYGSTFFFVSPTARAPSWAAPRSHLVSSVPPRRCRPRMARWTTVASRCPRLWPSPSRPRRCSSCTPTPRRRSPPTPTKASSPGRTLTRRSCSRWARSSRRLRSRSRRPRARPWTRSSTPTWRTTCASWTRRPSLRTSRQTTGTTQWSTHWRHSAALLLFTK
jgi:hypothetical protein